MLERSKQADTAMMIAAQIAPMLHGLGPDVQGAVLADLTATWLSGFQEANAEAQRTEILEAHIKAIRALVPINERMLLERLQIGSP